MRFDEIFREMEAFQRRILRSAFEDLDRYSLFGDGRDEDIDPFGRHDGELEAFEKNLETEKPQGEWRFERIDRPGVKGFIAKGFFSSPGILKRPEEILPPLRPEPKGPREPLNDIHEEDERIRIYMELPGVEEDEIDLEVSKEALRLEAGDFKTEIDLSSWILDIDGMSRSYRNGVLEVVIPRLSPKKELV